MHPDPQRGDDDLRRVSGVAGRPGVLAGGRWWARSRTWSGRGSPGASAPTASTTPCSAGRHAQKHLAQAERWFERYGDPVVFFSRMLPIDPHVHLAAGGNGADAVRPLLRPDLPGLHPVVASSWSRSATSPGRTGRRGRSACTCSTIRSIILLVALVSWLATATKARSARVDFSAVPVPLMDIRGQYADLLPEMKQLVCDVIDSGRFILGPNVRALEVGDRGDDRLRRGRRGRERHRRPRAWRSRALGVGPRRRGDLRRPTRSTRRPRRSPGRARPRSSPTSIPTRSASIPPPPSRRSPSGRARSSRCTSSASPPTCPRFATSPTGTAWR